MILELELRTTAHLATLSLTDCLTATVDTPAESGDDGALLSAVGASYTRAALRGVVLLVF